MVILIQKIQFTRKDNLFNMKKYLKASLICVLLLFSYCISATNLPLGTLAKSSMILDVNNCHIATYNICGTTYVALSKLRAAGFNTTYTGKHEPIYINAPVSAATIQDLTASELAGKEYTLYRGDVYIGYLKTQALSCEGTVLIPVASLNAIFDSNLSGNNYMLTPKVEAPILATQTSLKNYSAEAAEVSLTDLYWDNGLIQKQLYFTLAPNEVLQRQATSDKKYLTTIVNTVVSGSTYYKNTTLCGQNNEELLHYIDFEASLPENFGDQAPLSVLYQATKTVNDKKLTSSTKYLVYTNLDQQRTYIFTNDNGTWSLLKHFICSSGKPSTPTPRGVYKLTKKVPSFGQNHGYCCKNAFGFIGTTYLYHSILFDKTGTYLLEGRGVLGKKASDGCIRLSPENSEWFYNNMISGTTVWID